MKEDIINEYAKKIKELSLKKPTSSICCKCFAKKDFTEEFHKFAGLISNHSIRLFCTADFIFIWVSDSLEVPVLTSIK